MLYNMNSESCGLRLLKNPTKLKRPYPTNPRDHQLAYKENHVI